ncbi:hypothetical protein D6789_02585 [Candidatus Woesearchaeota archaeon]|nr:MAG: hypothetical protein D6789_02585 [Candidatus Woesearchaeota archaeon]
MGKDIDAVLAQLNLPQQRVMTRQAGRARRVLAFLADIFIVNAFVLSPLSTVVPTTFTLGVISKELYAVFTVMMLIFLGYFWLLEYGLGQTPGQLLLGLETRGVTFWRGLLRNLHFLPFMPFPFLLLVEPIVFFLSGERLLARWTMTETIERR